MTLSTSVNTGTTHTYPPLSEVRKDLQIKWYRSPIPKETLWQLMERSNRKGFVQTLGHLGLVGALGTLVAVAFEQAWWPVFGVALWVLGSVSSGFLRSSASHELMHGTVFRTPALNRFFLRLICLPAWYNYNESRMSHSFHHRYTLYPDGDREVHLPKQPSLHPKVLAEMFLFNVRGMIRVVRATVRMALGRFDMDQVCSIGGQGATGWTWALSEVHPDTYRAAVRLARITLLFHASVLVISIVFQLWWLSILLSGTVFIGTWWSYFVGIGQHAGLRDNVPDFRLNSRSIRLDPVSSFLYWHMENHLEHHMFAAVPCYNMARLHRAIEPDVPARQTLFGMWCEIRQIWKQQRTDPDYQYDTPLPAGARPSPATQDAVPALLDGSVEELAGSIGALAPNDDAPIGIRPAPAATPAG